jgi:hypothetical protein
VLSAASFCLRAYLAYPAYVNFGMPMQLSQNRKAIDYGVLSKNMASLWITNSANSIFDAIIAITQSNPCGQNNQERQTNLPASCLHRTMT